MGEYLPEAHLPSAEDIAAFARNGWYISPRILPDSLLDTAMAGVARYRAGARDRELPAGADYFDWRPEDGLTLQQTGYLSLQIAEIAALVRWPAIAATAARLLQVDAIRLFHDRLIVKPAAAAVSDTVVGWHTDRAYWRTCTSTDMLTAWIPFQDTTADMGALMVMDGSHRWTGNDWMTTAHEHDLEALESRVSRGGEPIRKVVLELARGQVSFHHCGVVHGSAGNTTVRPRMALSLHLQATGNRYRPVAVGGRRLGHLNDLICRTGVDGHPDYSDPAIFPQLWPPS